MSMHTLAQFNPAETPEVAMLPAPPLWEVWLFERPWTPSIVLVLLGVGAWWFFNQRSQARRGVQAAGACMLLALLVVSLATLVTTARETLAQRTRALIGGVARAEIGALTELLAPDAAVLLNGQTWLLGRDRILRGVDETTGSSFKVAPNGARVLEEHQQVLRGAGDSARTQVWVRIEGVNSSFFGRSWWRISWRREDASADAIDAGGPKHVWRVTTIDLLQIDGLSDPAGLMNVVPN